MSNIIDNVNNIYKEINDITKNKRSVEIVAATKTRNISEIFELINNTDTKIAGENRVQEFISKYDKNITWDFIGRLQTNKVKYIIDKVRLIHSVDRYSLLEKINIEANKIQKVQDILLEINLGKEENKGGLLLEDVETFAEKTKAFENVRLRGIMAVAPLEIDKKLLQKYFNNAYCKYEKLKLLYNNIDYLSMGMSNDYALAVECGANIIRLGRAIFGERK